MASVLATSALHMNTINFYEVTSGAYDSRFNNNIYLYAGGTIFEDMYTVYWLGGVRQTSSYLGSGFVLDGQGNFISGTVNAYVSLIWYGTSFFEDWEISNFSISASVLYNAHITPSTSDDFAVIQSILSGSDNSPVVHKQISSQATREMTHLSVMPVPIPWTAVLAMTPLKAGQVQTAWSAGLVMIATLSTIRLIF
jgi:hypothetical protein